MKAIIALLFLICTIGFAQKPKQMNICYGEKINLGKVDDDVKFIISSDFETVSLNGKEINNYIFSKPGIYKIKINEVEHKNSESCNHNHFPKEIALNVSRVKMVFEGSSLKLSEPIIKNRATDGIKLSIPITIETYDNKTVMLNNSFVNSSGIGTNIVAKLDDQIKEVPVGKHIINYYLTGKVSENSYLMFDFVDANGLIQSVALVNPIQN